MFFVIFVNMFFIICFFKFIVWIRIRFCCCIVFSIVIFFSSSFLFFLLSFFSCRYRHHIYLLFFTKFVWIQIAIVVIIEKILIFTINPYIYIIIVTIQSSVFFVSSYFNFGSPSQIVGFPLCLDYFDNYDHVLVYYKYIFDSIILFPLIILYIIYIFLQILFIKWK